MTHSSSENHDQSAKPVHRRRMIQVGTLAMTAAWTLSNSNDSTGQLLAQETKPAAAPQTYPFKLPPLQFDYAALEPHIDTATMKLHHDKHHQTYVDNLNAAVKDYPDLHTKTVEQLLRGLKGLPEKIQTVVRNHGGGHANHDFFWKILRPTGTAGAGGPPKGKLAEAITSTFSSVDGLKKAFNEAGTKVFGSGWVFLVADTKTSKLKIHTSANQDSVYLEDGLESVIANDCWEHAYYLKYQNKRADYLNAFWNVLAWDVVSTRFDEIQARKA